MYVAVLAPLSSSSHADSPIPPLRSSFAYFAPPGKTDLHGENISLIIKFFLGSHDWFHFPIPINIAVESIVGTVRLRCQMVSQAPFIRNVTFTLMGVPAIEAVRSPSLPLLAAPLNTR